MDIVLVFNGLGNQMSQYAFYLQKKDIDSNTRFIDFCHSHNGFELEKIFNIKPAQDLKQRYYYLIFRMLLTDKIKFISTLFQRILKKKDITIVKENFDYQFKSDYLLPSKGITYYFGGWHTERYFKQLENKILETFQFTAPNDALNKAHIKEIERTNSISIHIRRGDFLDKDNINLFGGVCTQTYYETAIKFIESKHEAAHFFVFSNDMEWVKNNLKFKQATFVNNNTGKNSWKDMFLMSICNHNIIANSSFSWWGAWLNKNKNKMVICPDKFSVNDTSSEVYPESWIKINPTQP